MATRPGYDERDERPRSPQETGPHDRVHRVSPVAVDEAMRQGPQGGHSL